VEIKLISLIVVCPGQKKFSINLSKNKIILGRSSRSDIKINDEQISALHLQLKIEQNGRLAIKDMDSTNGTLVNELAVSEAFIYIDDVIRIGNTTLQINRSLLDQNEMAIHTPDVKINKKSGISLQGGAIEIDSSKEENNLKYNGQKKIHLNVGKKHKIQIDRMKAHANKVARQKKQNKQDEIPAKESILLKLIKLFKKDKS